MGMWKKFASGVLGLLPCSCTPYTVRPATVVAPSGCCKQSCGLARGKARFSAPELGGGGSGPF